MTYDVFGGMLSLTEPRSNNLPSYPTHNHHCSDVV